MAIAIHNLQVQDHQAQQVVITMLFATDTAMCKIALAIGMGLGNAGNVVYAKIDLLVLNQTPQAIQ